MEEIIEQLREANEPVPVPLELPDEDMLVEIEEQLFIDIPFVFREFLFSPLVDCRNTLYCSLLVS